MERPNYKSQALINHCKSILELYDRSLCTQCFHRFANKRNVEHNLWWLSDWVAIRLTWYVVTRVTEKKYSSIYFHLRNGCMEQNCSERWAFLYEYDVFLFKKYVRRKGICWRLISLPFPLKTMWTPKSSSPLLTPLFRKNTRWWSLFLFNKIFWLTSAILIEMLIFNTILYLPIMTFT